MKQAKISSEARKVLIAKPGALEALQPLLDKFLANAGKNESVSVEVWHDDRLYIEVEQDGLEHPYNMRALVTFNATKMQLALPGEQSQYHFSRKGWVKLLTELLGAAPTVYCEADGSRAHVPFKGESAPTLEDMVASWEQEAKSSHMLWKSAALQIAGVIREHAPEKALDLLKKANPKEMAVSAFYERAINELKTFLRKQKLAATA